MMNLKKLKIKGIGLVEAVVVVSIISVSFAALLASAVLFIRVGLMTADRAQALYLLEEGVEAVRFMRDTSYSSKIVPLVGVGVRYLEPDSSGFTATTTNNAIFGSFTRTIELTTVYRRNSDDDIVPSTSGDPKTIDPDTTNLKVTVSWPGSSVETTTYVANLKDN